MLDEIDIGILESLQQDATRPIAEVAKRVNLSTTPCWRRIEKLKQAGVIEREVALLNRPRLNVGLTAFVGIRTNQHSPEWLKQFAAAIRDIPEIVECYRMSGETDYMLRVVIPDVAAFDGVYNQLISRIELYDVTTSFAMEDLKYSTALPLGYAE